MSIEPYLQKQIWPVGHSLLILVLDCHTPTTNSVLFLPVNTSATAPQMGVLLNFLMVHCYPP
jgi:hypothetical protein